MDTKYVKKNFTLYVLVLVCSRFFFVPVLNGPSGGMRERKKKVNSIVFGRAQGLINRVSLRIISEYSNNFNYLSNGVFLAWRLNLRIKSETSWSYVFMETQFRKIIDVFSWAFVRRRDFSGIFFRFF